MTITADSLLPRPKLDYDVGYDAAVKGASVVVPVYIIIRAVSAKEKDALCILYAYKGLSFTEKIALFLCDAEFRRFDFYTLPS